MEEIVKICSIDEIKEGELLSVDVDGIQLMVTSYNGKYLVNSRICTHKTYDLTKGHYADGYVTCLLHTSVFDLEDGRPQNPPAIEKLNTYETIIKNGDLHVKI